MPSATDVKERGALPLRLAAASSGLDIVAEAVRFPLGGETRHPLTPEDQPEAEMHRPAIEQAGMGRVGPLDLGVVRGSGKNEGHSPCGKPGCGPIVYQLLKSIEA